MNAEMVSYDEIKTFFEDGWIDAVLFPVKSGKEATVYCCKACPGRSEAHFALKKYRPPQLPQHGDLPGGPRAGGRADHSGRQK